MGLVDRKKSGKIFNGSKLNVPGEGISVVKKGEKNIGDKPIIKKKD
jgi:hypothetical protein